MTGGGRIADLDTSERATLRKYELMLSRGERDISWNGPLARYLEMIGRRPIMENVDVGMTP